MGGEFGYVPQVVLENVDDVSTNRHGSVPAVQDCEEAGAVPEQGVEQLMLLAGGEPQYDPSTLAPSERTHCKVRVIMPSVLMQLTARVWVPPSQLVLVQVPHPPTSQNGFAEQADQSPVLQE